MMAKIFLIILLFCSFSSFSQSDRELLLEIIKQQATNNAKIDAMQKQIDIRFDAMQKQMDTRFEGVDKRFDGVDKRFDDVNKRIDILLYVMIAMLTGIFGLIGFVFWDRKLAGEPLKKLQETDTNILKVLRAEAENNPNLKEILSRFGML
jgi:hypothetical protein